MTNTVLDTFVGKELQGFTLPLIHVYSNPTDMPNKFVARLFDIKDDGQIIPTLYCTVRDSLEEINETIPQGMHFINRNEDDEVQIVGTWV